jgi:hypothetical protein
MGKLYNQSEQVKNNYKKKKNNIGRMGIRTSNVQKLRFLVRMSFAIGEEKTKT